MRVSPMASAGIIGLMTLLVVPVTYAVDNTKTIPESRYVSVRAKPLPGQQDLLTSIVDIQMPERIQSVGQALEYLLDPFGFQLEAVNDIADQYLLFVLGLPEPHRQLGPMTLMDAIITLGSQSFKPIINPVKRTVQFQLREGFIQFATEDDKTRATQQWRVKQEGVSVPIDEGVPKGAPENLQRYGPIRSGESLSGIANQLDLKGLTMDQALVCLFRANPHAFANRNMNHLLVGVMLTIPVFEKAKSQPVIKAHQRADEHYRLWGQRGVMP